MDAQRHGVRFLAADVSRSDWACTIEDGRVRIGLRYVAGLRAGAGQRVEAERARAPFRSLQDFVDRASLHHDELTALAEAGALNAFGFTRRSALWQVEKAARPRGALLRRAEEADPAREPAEPSPLVEMTVAERLHADVVRTGLTVGPHPLLLHREMLAGRGVRRACDLARGGAGANVRVAGSVICRQRPGTAKGFVFLTLEDETGLVNIIVNPDLYHRHAEAIVMSPVLEIDGALQVEGGVAVRARDVRPVHLPDVKTKSRDFH
jgi:error-prone DNA polymerase